MFDHIRNTTTEETWKSILKDISDKKTHLEVGFVENIKFERKKIDWISTVTFLIYLVQNFQQYLDDLKLQLGLTANVDFSGLIIQNFQIKNFENPQYSNRSQTRFFVDKKDFLQIFAFVKILEEFRWSPIHSKRVKTYVPFYI